MGPEEMEAFRHILRTQAAFAGVEVVTYCFMTNHFHLLLRVDPQAEVGDPELVRRFRALYGTKRSASLGVDAEALELLLARDDDRAMDLRKKLKARMGQVPPFMQELKARFTLWYNAQHDCVGTFWAERYRRVLVEPGSQAARLVAAYIDLNPLRAGLVEDPLSYRFSGLGEAVGGGSAARRGLCWLDPVNDRIGRVSDARNTWQRHLSTVRRAMLRSGDPGTDALPEGDRLSELQLAYRQCRYFSEGLAIGTRAWVSRFCKKGGRFGFRRTRSPSPIPGFNEGDTAVTVARQRFRQV
ncbi:MAG: hypothetical protein JJT96_01475 [Opitutales bacterium]|nr:hypothetical protein [Opitutales bacterium]